MKRRKPQFGRKFVDANGYVRVRGETAFVYEHRLVWEQAHGTIPAGFHVHHKNGDKADNRLENLELREPRSHVGEHTRVRHAAGEINTRGRWLVLDEDYIRRRKTEGASLRQIARELGVTNQTIARRLRP
jgi:hypothetical protein